MAMKHSNNYIRNRTRNLPACNAVQLTERGFIIRRKYRQCFKCLLVRSLRYLDLVTSSGRSPVHRGRSIQKNAVNRRAVDRIEAADK